MTGTPSRARAADVARAYTELSRITRRAAVRARGPEAALSVVDHSLVDFVEEHPGCMAVDIARYLRLNRSTISRQLAGLLGAGLVATTDGGSGNAKPLRVTDAGRRALERSVRIHRTGLEARLASWSDDDVALLAGLLERLGASEEPGFEPGPLDDADPAGADDADPAGADGADDGGDADLAGAGAADEGASTGQPVGASAVADRTEG